MLPLYSSIQSFILNAKKRVSREEDGATAVEYGIMVALIAVVIIVAVTLLGGNLLDLFNEMACKVGGGAWSAGAGTAPGSCTYPTP